MKDRTNQEIAVEIVRLAIRLPKPNIDGIEINVDERGSLIWYEHSKTLIFSITYTKSSDTIMQYILENNYQQPSRISNVTKVIALFKEMK